MSSVEQLVALGALMVAGWLVWQLAHGLARQEGRRELLLSLRDDPVRFVLGAGGVLCVIGMLLWIGTFGRLPLGWAAVGMIAFGIAYLAWYELYSRKRGRNRPTPPRN